MIPYLNKEASKLMDSTYTDKRQYRQFVDIAIKPRIHRHNKAPKKYKMIIFLYQNSDE